MPKVLEEALMERRSGERASRVVAISHRLLQRGRGKVQSDWSLSMTKDMSHSGLLFLSNIPYIKGDLLQIHVVMSGVIDIYSGQAEVVRAIEKGATSFDIGVRFLDPKIQKRDAKSHLKK